MFLCQYEFFRVYHLINLLWCLGYLRSGCLEVRDRILFYLLDSWFLSDIQQYPRWLLLVICLRKWWSDPFLLRIWLELSFLSFFKSYHMISSFALFHSISTCIGYLMPIIFWEWIHMNVICIFWIELFGHWDFGLFSCTTRQSHFYFKVWFCSHMYIPCFSYFDRWLWFLGIIVYHSPLSSKATLAW